MVYCPGEGGWGGKTIRTKRDKSVVNSIKVLMFARSANTRTHTYSTHTLARRYCTIVFVLYELLQSFVKFHFGPGGDVGGGGHVRVYSSSVSSALRQNLKPIIILYTYTKLVPVHKYTMYLFTYHNIYCALCTQSYIDAQHARVYKGTGWP